MKKKFLSLMMAAAMVATTSISAFAADTSVETPATPNVITQDDKEGSADVTITGKIADEQDNMPADSFRVTVPTAANFTVTKKGFYGPKLEVKNAGSQEIEVYAQSFTRIDGGTGTINTVKAQQIKEDSAESPALTRADVALNLEGESNQKAYLKVSSGETGVYTDDALAKSAGDKGVKLLSLGAGDGVETKGSIRLNGSAGTGRVGTAITDKFQLTLKIKKVTKGTEGAVGAGRTGQD